MIILFVWFLCAKLTHFPRQEEIEERQCSASFFKFSVDGLTRFSM